MAVNLRAAQPSPPGQNPAALPSTEGMKPAVEAAAALTKTGIRRTEVVEIPLELDHEIKELARYDLQVVKPAGL